MPLSSNPEFRIQSNFLYVDGRMLRTTVLDIPESAERPVSPEEFKRILSLGQKSIFSAEFFRLWTIRLGDTGQTDGRNSEVYTAAGYAENSGVLHSVDQITEPFRDYWRAIESAGYTPEVRSTSGDLGGSWMLLGRT